jgi:hypothetical protein
MEYATFSIFDQNRDYRLSLANRPQPESLITTHRRAGVAIGAAALEFQASIRTILNQGNVPSNWLFEAPGLPEWTVVAGSLFFYGFICWISFWMIRGTHGRERVFMVAWFLNVLLWPARVFQHEWILEIRYVGAFGQLIALIVGITFLHHPSQQSEFKSF